MNSSVSYAAMPYVYTSQAPPSGHPEYTTDLSPEMASSVREVEKLLHYNFKRVSLLEEALTHSSYTHSTSYERLEFVGDASLGLAVTNFLFSTYPDLGPGQLTRLRAANVSNEKLARAAVKRGLHRYIRHNVPADNAVHEKVRDFVTAVEQEDETVVIGGEIKPPKILADIVESVAAAVCIDCGFDFRVSWPILKRLLEPLVTLDLLEEQSQSVTMLLELCKRDGRKVEIRRSKEGKRNINIAKVFVDGKLIASTSSKKWENARIHAAKTALQELSYHTTTKPLSHSVESALDHTGLTQELSYNNDCKNIGSGMDYLVLELDGCGEIEGAKHKLRELCEKRKWPKPRYRTEKKTGPRHDLSFICSVRIETGTKGLLAMGEEKSRVKYAENSAASLMLLALQESKYLWL